MLEYEYVKSLYVFYITPRATTPSGPSSGDDLFQSGLAELPSEEISSWNSSVLRQVNVGILKGSD